MKTPTKAVMARFVIELRALGPYRPLSYGESLDVARTQAAYLRRWARATEPDINLIWLLHQQAVPVHRVPSHQLNETSGLTTNSVNNIIEIFINQAEPPTRQRFSLLHEFKHALDFTDADVLHARLGSGYPRHQRNMIEKIANDFAAHVLMPTALVKRVWSTFRDVSLAAAAFNVSIEAMATRLEKLNLIGEPPRTPRTYFRCPSPADYPQDTTHQAA
jgi:hypothetical protein